MYRHVLSLLAGTMVAFALASTAPITLAQGDLSEELVEPLPSEQIKLQEYNLRLSGFGGVKFMGSNDELDDGASFDELRSMGTVHSDADQQFVFGGELEWNLEGYNNSELPISLVLAFAMSNAEDDEGVGHPLGPPAPDRIRDEDLEVMEIRLGIRGTFDLPILNDFNRAHIYVGVGAAWARAEYDVTIKSAGSDIDVDGSGDGLGWYVGGGVYWDVFNNITVGIDITHSQVEVAGGDLDDLEIGGTSIVLAVGFKF